MKIGRGQEKLVAEEMRSYKLETDILNEKINRYRVRIAKQP